jgi:hypothetical protein
MAGVWHTTRGRHAVLHQLHLLGKVAQKQLDQAIKIVL